MSEPQGSNFLCPHCGREHRQGAKFCPSTGKPITGQIQGPVTPPLAQGVATPGPGSLQPVVSDATSPDGLAGLTGKLPVNSFLNNRYLILRKAGQGGMAAVYQAADVRQPGALWAVKEMSDAALSAADRNYAVQAFLQEANLLRTLNHPNLPRVVDVFNEGGKHYLVMEFVNGQTLQNMLEGRTQPFSETEVLNWAVQLCDVFIYLHSQNPKIIFRDLKPSNIMLTTEGQIKLIDFGIVRFFKPGKTRDTMALGTPGYSSPEASGGQTDERSDLYSLCVTLHQLLTLNDPCRTMFRLPPLRQLNPAVSPELTYILERGYQNQRDLRWESISQMREALMPLARNMAPFAWSQTATAVVAPVLGRAAIPGQMAANQAPVEPYPVRTVASPVATMVSPAATVVSEAGPSQAFAKTSRPTARLMMAAVQLPLWQVLLIGFGLVGALVAAILLFAPLMDEMFPPEFWNNLPIMAIFGALGYAAYPKRGMVFISHTFVSLILVSTIWLRLGDQGYSWGGLILGALMSGVLMEIWVAFLPRVKGNLGQEGWVRELVWLVIMAMVGTALFLGITTGWSTGMHLEQWVVSAVLGAAGWFLGDMLQQFLLYRKTGLRRLG